MLEALRRKRAAMGRAWVERHAPLPEMPLATAPHIVRAHHTPNYACLDAQYTPESLARAVRISAQQREDPTYFLDRYGPTPESADEVEQNETLVYAAYKGLPNNHPIAVVVDQKSAVCDTSFAGGHCTRKFKYSDYRDPDSFVLTFPDEEYIGQMLGIAERRELTGFVTVSSATSLYTNAEPEQHRQLIMAKGTFRTILRDLRPIEYF